MASIIIRNDGTTESSDLSNRFKDLLSTAKTFDMLVGFFHFSGFKTIKAALDANQNVRLKILVGMNAESFAGRIVEIYRNAEEDSKEELEEMLRERFKQDLQVVFGSDFADTNRFFSHYEMYLKLIAQGRLEIRKTKCDNHAKMYLFELDNNALRQTWITGSSNFSISGLRDRAEMNVELGAIGYDEARAYFDELWEESIDVTSEIPLQNQNVLTPYEAYLLLLKHYVSARARFDVAKRVSDLFELPKNEEGKPKYKSFKYQMDAVEQARAIIDDFGGVIIGDVVGLGKSVVGTVLAKSLEGRPKGMVIAPPGLCGDRAESTGWWGYLHDWNLLSDGWTVCSSGNLEDARKEIDNAAIERRPYDTIIVDEAHRFRNDDTESYEKLFAICLNKKVILMTATPFNNAPSEVFSLMKLFGQKICRDSKDRFVSYQRDYSLINKFIKDLKKKDFDRSLWTVNNVRDLIRLIDVDPDSKSNEQLLKLLRSSTGELSKKMRHELEPIMVRRNRLDLLKDPEYSLEIEGNITTLEPPEEQFYKLTKKQSEFYDEIIGDYFKPDEDAPKFKGTIYFPYLYTKEGKKPSADNSTYWQQANMVKFMRRLLVKRFESSFNAFKKTVENIKNSCRLVKQVIDRYGIVPVSSKARALADGIIDDDDKTSDFLIGDVNEEEIQTKIDSWIETGAAYSVKEDFTQADLKRFKKNIDEDLKLLGEISDKVEVFNLLNNDPKVIELAKIVEDVVTGVKILQDGNDKLKKRKVLIFTEYGDTAEHIGEKLKLLLKSNLQNRVLVVYGDLSSSMRDTILRNFDASQPNNRQTDDFDIIVTTDKLSEGFNLARAGLVINYDIPWNPVRVIQRVGRINRIGTKVFEKLYTYNFFPTEIGNDIVGQRRVAQQKMFMINNAIGEDSQILSPEEEVKPSNLFNKLKRIYDEQDEGGENGCSFYSKVRSAWLNAKMQNDEITNKIDKIYESQNENFRVFVKRSDLKVGEKIIGDPRSLMFARNVVKSVDGEKYGTKLVAYSVNKIALENIDGEQKPLEIQENQLKEIVEDAISFFECKELTASQDVPVEDSDYWYENAWLKRKCKEKNYGTIISLNTNQNGSAESKALRTLGMWQMNIATILPEEIDDLNLREFVSDNENGAQNYIVTLIDEINTYRRLPQFTLKRIDKKGRDYANNPIEVCKYLYGLKKDFGDLIIDKIEDNFKIILGAQLI